MARALLIEESGDLRASLQDYLQARGIETYTAKGLVDATALISAVKPDVTTLDVELQDGDGYSLIPQISKAGSHCVVVSSRWDVGDRIKALSLGADDYVAKPVNLEELYLRMRNILANRRPAQGSPSHAVLDLNGIRIDPVTRAVLGPDGAPGAELSETELTLLRILSDNMDRVVSKEALFQEIYGRSYSPTTRSLDVGVSRLRAKLKASRVALEIRSVRSAGYMLLRDRQ